MFNGLVICHEFSKIANAKKKMKANGTSSSGQNEKVNRQMKLLKTSIHPYPYNVAIFTIFTHDCRSYFLWFYFLRLNIH